MKPLPKDLQTPKQSLDEFSSVTKRVLGYLPNVVSEKTEARDYLILSSLVAGTSKFAEHPVKVVGIFLNDVQRKETEKISYTFVSGLFMVYTKFLTQLEGVYFVDPPPITQKSPFNQHIAPFSKFIARDIWKLLSP